ncbi:hypothetical protein GF366_03965 [Candidatus Peregrinibacteria bacterium]|nr:hypothetical protein [Candidatus Peregrinibacteria bacterium]
MIDNKIKDSDSIIFYCKDCEKIVDTERVGRKYVYKCKKCGTKNVAFGTERSIRSFFRLDEKKQGKKKEKKEKTKQS